MSQSTNRPPNTRPNTAVGPQLTEAEIAAILADARQNDPQGSNAQFYYSGYQSRTDLHEGVSSTTAAAASPGEFQSAESELYYYPLDKTWRMYKPEPTAAAVVVSEKEEEEEEEEVGPSGRQRKRDRLKALVTRTLSRRGSRARKA